MKILCWSNLKYEFTYITGWYKKWYTKIQTSSNVNSVVCFRQCGGSITVPSGIEIENRQLHKRNLREKVFDRVNYIRGFKLSYFIYS